MKVEFPIAATEEIAAYIEKHGKPERTLSVPAGGFTLLYYADKKKASKKAKKGSK